MRLIGILYLCLFSIVAWSQNSNSSKGDTTENQRLFLNEVTVNAPLRISSINNWPGSISLLDSLQLNKGNSYLLSQQLNSLPGLTMQQGALNTSRITIRGIGSRTPYNSNRIKAYWGDIPLTDGDGVSSIEDLTFNDINGIKVLKGPSSALYGAGLGGVILIDSWSSFSKEQWLRIKSEAAAYSTFSNQITAQHQQNNGLTTFSASHLSSQGYRDNSQYNRFNFTLKGQSQLGKSRLNYLYNYRYLNGHIPSSLDSTDFYTNPEKAADSWAAIKGYEKSNRHIFNIGIITPVNHPWYHQANVFAVISDLDELRPFNRLDESKMAIGIRDKHTLQFKNFKLEAGFEAMHEKNKLSFLGVKDDNLNLLLNKSTINRSYVNLFLLAETKITEQLLIQAALNVNWTNYNSKNNLSETLNRHQYSTIASPHLGINYEFRPGSNIFASAGHGFSAPSVEEAQLPDGSFNEAIEPEEAWQFDMGYRYNSDNNNTHAEVTVYWINMNNLLVTKRESEEVFYGVNAGKTKHKGVELQLSQLIKISTNNQLKITASHSQSINKFEEFIDDGINQKGNHLPGIPKFSTYISGDITINKMLLSINYQHWGRQYLSDGNEKLYPDFGVLNAKLTQAFQYNSIKGNFFLGANNIMDKHYASMLLINAPSFGNSAPRYYYPAMPFNLYGGFTIAL
jgi:iron complex outermembrane receptor protein